MKHKIFSVFIIALLLLTACRTEMKKSNEEMFKDFGYEVIAAPFTPGSISDYFRTTQKKGLEWAEGWLSVSLQSDNGQRYGFVRGYEKTSSNLILSFKMRDDLLDVSSKLFKKLYTGKIVFDLTDGQEAVVIKSNPSKHNFHIQLNVNKIHWKEESGDIDLQFESLGPAFGYYIPGGRIKEELYYTEELFRATGKVLGETVNGYGSLDQVWLPPGIDWFESKGFLFFEDQWIVWANRYPDGSTDYGLVISGPENWNICFYADGGEIYTPENNNIDIKWAEEGYPLKVDVAMDNNRLQFQWTCKQRILEVKDMGLWANGQMINLAKKNKPVEGYAWFEGILFHKRNIPYSFLKSGSGIVSKLPNSLKSHVYEKMFSRGLKN